MAVWLFCGLLRVGAAGADGLPAPPVQDFIPAEWSAVSLAWKDTWDETLAANLPRLAPPAGACHTNAVPVIAGLREIELYKALVEHFPGSKDNHGQAYLAIAAVCDRIGLPETGSYYLWKVTRESGGRQAQVAEAYARLAARSSGLDAMEGTVGASMPDEALDLAEKGAIPAGHDAILLACEAVRRRICEDLQYDRFLSESARFERWSKVDPRIARTLAALRQCFGGAEGGSLPSMPGNPELDVRWETVEQGIRRDTASRPLDPVQIQKILDLAAVTDAYVRKGENHYVAFRAMIEAGLAVLPDATLAPLRAEQERAAALRVRALGDAQDAGELARVSQVYPYAPSVHGAWLDFGERAMRDGRIGDAAHAFRQVIRHSDDAASRAEAGLDLYLALGSSWPLDDAEMQAALAAIPDSVAVRWRGTTLEAGRVKAELRSRSAGGGERRGLDGVGRLLVKLPSDWPLAERHGAGPRGDGGLHVPWPALRIEQRGAVCRVTGAGRMLSFHASAERTVWDITLEGGSGNVPARPVRAPGPYPPWRGLDRRPIGVAAGGDAAAAGGGGLFVLSRGGRSVEARDAETGRLLWSTHGRDEWARLAPMSQPASASGRAYVLAVPSGSGERGETVESPGPWFLICLDGRDGRTLWKTSISWQKGGVLDLARYGEPVTVHEGAVYCCPNMGILARCDAHDGHLEWVRGYGSAVGNVASPADLAYRREGTAPVVAGRRLFAAPRDHSGVIAVSADTGELVWDTPMVPSDRLIGVSGKALIVMNGEWVAALNAATGGPNWYRRFPEGTGSQAALVGSNVVVLSKRQLALLSAETGKTLEERALDGDPDAAYAFLPNGVLAGLIPPRLAAAQAITNAPAAPLAAPLVRVADIKCEAPSVLVPDASAGTPAVFCILSGLRIACVVTEPTSAIRWSRTLRRRPSSAQITGSRVILGEDRRLLALNLADGADAWALQVPFAPRAVGGDDRLVLAVPGRRGVGQIAAIDPASGRRLWARALTAPARFRGGIGRVDLSAPGKVQVVLSTLFADRGWQPGQVELDAATGRIVEVRPFASPPDQKLGFCGEALVYAGADPAVRVSDPGAATAGLAYALPKPDAPGVHEILAHRVMGDRVIVVSGVTGRPPHVPGKPRAAYAPGDSRVYVDFFEAASRRHLARQTLEGAVCGAGGEAGGDTGAEVLGRAVVVADVNGVHVYEARQAPGGAL